MNKALRPFLSSCAIAFLVLGLTLGLTSQQSWSVDEILTLTPEEKEILSHMELVFLDDGNGNLLKTIRIQGVNVQVVNGLGATNGNPANPSSVDPGLVVVNGLGNLIVGYQELGAGQNNRTGSHNLIGGSFQQYRSFGGLAVGRGNELQGAYAAVAGGENNSALGDYASVSGGAWNDALGPWASISGGVGNDAEGDWSSILGGDSNTASGGHSTVAGGMFGEASGNSAAVCGGQSNEAIASYSTVSGGRFRDAPDLFDWSAGHFWADD